MILIIITITILASSADALLKIGATRAGGALTDHLSLVLIPWVWLGAGLGLAALALWVYILGRHHMSHAYPVFVGFSFLNISLASILFLGETLSGRRIAGVLLVLASISEIGRGAGRGRG